MHFPTYIQSMKLFYFFFRLVHDRELQLHDGKRLLRADRYDGIKSEYNKSDGEMSSSGICRIHPSFKIVALAEPPDVNDVTGQWLNSEILNLFIFHEMRHLDKHDEIHIIKEKVNYNISIIVFQKPHTYLNT